MKRSCGVFLLMCIFNIYTLPAQVLSFNRPVESALYKNQNRPFDFKVEYPTQGFDEKFKIRKQTFGTIIGLQRGSITNLVLGGEFHWKKMRFTRPKLWAANFSFEYNFGHNIAGYRAGFFYKVGKIALTYGASVCYITDFDKGSVGVTPSLGFRLAGFHLTTGYNILTNSPPEKKYNTIFVGLTYYFPVFSDVDIIRSKKKKHKDKDNFFKRIFKKKDKDNN